jgi:uncharacterized protein DUF3604
MEGMTHPRRSDRRPRVPLRGQAGGNTQHRNVIFRNAVVPSLRTSYMEQPTPQRLWNPLKARCLDGLAGCNVLAIPHNPNASG